MLQVVLFVLSVAIATVDSWSACSAPVTNCLWGCSEYTCRNGSPTYTAAQITAHCHSLGFDSDPKYRFDCPSNSCAGQGEYGRLYYTYQRCDTKCEADSVQCVLNGGIFVRNGSNCDCQMCTEPDTTFNESSCAYDPQQGKYLNIVNTITRTNCEVTVQERKYYSLTCDTTCNENSELTCMGSIDGVNVYLRSCNGKVTKCEADGSCDMAIRKVANGECENPNDPPSPTSSSGSSSSSEAGSSSGTGEDWEWLKDSLHVIHVTNRDSLGAINHNLENMQPFVAGTYDQVTDIAGTAHDINSNILTSFEFLNDIKENTGNTANNTNNINNKLTNTNQLLTDLNNKNWSVTVRPEITVQGDTNIVNVQTDTAHSGAAILDFLKGMFGGMDTTGNYDTTGWGGVNDSARGAYDESFGRGWQSQVNCDSARGNCDESVIGSHGLDSAKDSYRRTFRALGDSLRNGAFGDSLSNWGGKFTGNGVITGSGSNSCPSVLTRTYRIDLYGTAGFDMTLGTYLCAPIFGQTTAWTLCRLLIRASVALACMWFLFRCATGFGGRGGDDD